MNRSALADHTGSLMRWLLGFYTWTLGILVSSHFYILSCQMNLLYKTLMLFCFFYWIFSICSQYSWLVFSDQKHISWLECLYLSYPTFLLPRWQVIFALNKYLKQFLFLIVWFWYLVASLCLSADSFREYFRETP